MASYFGGKHEIIYKRLIQNGDGDAVYVKESCETVEIVWHGLNAFSRRRTSNALFASFMYSSYHNILVMSTFI